ncbi:porin family protein [Halomonas campisalis]|uniref:Porin family protein n=1 Tax=Billgrantia campisalis TaxID=74661 RepID=A0ABS9PC93_9GAMM|nr:porin family protein [Halomonas campisalis]MCG6659388.1 porin family protein [Halomonas campisalis]MDR5863990.1 porin family protein [Halomonas campisalis]
MKIFAVTSISALLLAGAFATTAQAQQPFYPQAYVGGDAMFWSLDPDGASSFDGVGLRLNGGAQFNEFFAVEGHLGTGGSDTNQGVKAELDYIVGAYAKGIVPVSQEFRIYGLAGVTEVKMTGSAGGFSGSDRESDFSYGAGAEFDVAPNLSVGADYMRYLDKSDGTFDAASVGVRYRF